MVEKDVTKSIECIKEASCATVLHFAKLSALFSSFDRTVPLASHIFASQDAEAAEKVMSSILFRTFHIGLGMNNFTIST